MTNESHVQTGILGTKVITQIGILGNNIEKTTKAYLSHWKTTINFRRLL